VNFELGTVNQEQIMSRIVCIDWGSKRCGIAVTDPLQIIATALATVDTGELLAFLRKYTASEPVEAFLVGEPKNLDDSDTHATGPVRAFVKKLEKEFPAQKVFTTDERMSSKLASRAMVDMGMKKKKRQEKGQVDQVAAAMMLQEYLASQG
jgi:putative Holliday junction resolvase